MRVNGDMDSPKTLNRISEIQDYIEIHPEVKMTASLSDLIKKHIKHYIIMMIFILFQIA